MNRISSRPSYGLALFLATLSIVSIALPFSSGRAAQDISREAAIKEAGRLGTEAERIRGEAYKKIRAGGDRRLIFEAERATAEKFRQALELWRAAQAYDRLAAGAEELSRIYSALNDYESAVSCLKREVEFWRERNDDARQVHMMLLIATRQTQTGRNEAALQTLEQVVAVSRAANLSSAEANALNDIARLYDKAGRGEEAEPLRARAKELWDQIYNSRPAEQQKQRGPNNLPSQWLDLPSAPLVAEYRDVEGVRQAVLVNRSTKGIEMVAFGCVKEQEGKARVVSDLIGMGQNHGGVSPGYYYQPFDSLNGPLNHWTDERMGCEGKARMAVIKAVYADRTEWEAEGADWTSR